MNMDTSIKELLEEKASNRARLNLLTYNGTPEIKDINGQKYLYVRKRELGRLTSEYVGPYSDELYKILLSTQKERKILTKNIREITKKLISLGYEFKDLSNDVILNIEFAKANMKLNIYNQAVLEGVGTTFPQTEEIINNGLVNNVAANDVQKILNLKHAWEFITDEDVASCPSDLSILTNIAKLVNEGFFSNGGKLRQVPVTIGGTSYVPSLPIEVDVKETIRNITNSNESEIIKAIKLALYVMKAQLFDDGNKRTAILFACHFLISNGKGLLVIPENDVKEFKDLLIKYYEGTDENLIIDFMEEKCIKSFK